MKGLAVLGIVLFLGVAVAPSCTSFYQEPEFDKIFKQSWGEGENYNCFIIGRTKVTLFGGFFTPPLGHSIGFGVYNPLFDETIYAQGWIHTIGFHGFRRWEGMLKGNLSISFRLILYHPHIGTGLYQVFEGISGFKGLRIGRRDTLFIGVARQIKIDEVDS